MSGVDLYWIALNLLPFPPVAVRSLHEFLRSEARAGRGEEAGDLTEALGRLTSAQLSSFLSARGRFRAPAGEGEKAPSGHSGPDWWRRVMAGHLGYASPRFPEAGEIPCGERLLATARIEIQDAEAAGIVPITIADARYPALLAQIHSPPPVLYAQGDLARFGKDENRGQRLDGAAVPWWWSGETRPPTAADQEPERLSLAVVGSREATDYGRAVSRRLARFLAEAGAVVVSGLARGIDGEAHAGCLDANGFTIAVLAGGLARPSYPRSNRGLARRIERHGLLLSEFPLGTPAQRGHFPRRNRIIAGLCAGVVVVEAALRSGALITARLALEEGRDVFAVPGRITSLCSGGTNGLIRAGAAYPVTRESDVMEDLSPYWKSLLPNVSQQTALVAPVPPGDLGATERALFDLLRVDEAASVDLLVARCGFPAGDILASLVSLELRGLARSLPGGRYLLIP